MSVEMTPRHPSLASGSPIRRSTETHERPNYVYPPVPMLQQPPPSAHITYAKRVSEGQTTDSTRAHGSISSASGSSGTSNQKRQTPSPCFQWPSPTLERTLVDSGGHHPRTPTQWQPAGSARTGHSRKRSEMTQHTSPTVAYIRDQQQIEEEDDEEEEDHALWILFWLSCLDPVHCFASCLFTGFVTFGLLLASPIRLCKKQSSFGDQIIRALAPIFKHHLEVMYAPSVDYAFEWDFRPGMLVFIQIVSPLLSIGVAIATWVTAAFWVFTSIMGNPDGTERRDDGRDAVLTVRNWWESCLLMAIRPRIRPLMQSAV